MTGSAFTAFVCIILIAWPSNVGAQGFRVPTPLAQLVGSADAIVFGEIATVTSEFIELSATEVILARVDVDRRLLSIERMARAPTDPRWAPYRAGQQVVLFLKRSDDEGNRWSFAGPANDSEWPVDEGKVYLYDRFVEELPLQNFSLDGQEFHAQALSYETVAAALRDYGTVFRWEKSVTDDVWRPIRRCGRVLAADFPVRSPLHQLLVRETEAMSARP